MGFTPQQLDEMERQSSGGFGAPKTATSTKKRYTAAELDAMERQSQPEEPGFVQSVVQGIAKPFLRTGVSEGAPLGVLGLPMKLLKPLANKTTTPFGKETYDFGYLGKVEPLGQKDTTWENIKDTTGVGLELASNAIPAGKLAPLAKASIAGKVWQGVKTGAGAGFKSGTMYGVGSELQNDDATLGSTIESGITGGIGGTLGGGAIGGALPLPVGAVNAVRSASNPEDYTRRVVQISKPNYQKFIRSSGGDTPEKFLTDRGIVGTNEEMAAKLYERFNTSKGVVDDELAKLGGTWSDPSLKAALRELVDLEAPTMKAGIQSQDSSRIMQLAQKEAKEGLTMSEINEVKRLFERNVKTGYLRENVAAKVKYATDIDSALREWQLETARKLGLNNLDELNKETRLSRELADAIYRRTTGKADEGGLDFIDSVLISGRDPYSIGLFAARKGVKSERLKAGLAKKLMGNKPPKIGMPTAKTRAPLMDESRLLPRGNANTTNPIYMPPAKPKPLSQAEIEANNAFQAERQASWKTPLGLPAGTPNAISPTPIPLRPRNTIEPPAKVIRKYDSLNPLLQESNPIQLPQRTQSSAKKVATPSKNSPTKAIINDSISQSVKKSSPDYIKNKITPEGYYTEDRYPDSAYAKQFIANKDIPDSNIKKGDKFAIIDRTKNGGGYKALREKPIQDPESGLWVREHSYINPKDFTHQSQKKNLPPAPPNLLEGAKKYNGSEQLNTGDGQIISPTLANFIGKNAKTFNTDTSFEALDGMVRKKLDANITLKPRFYQLVESKPEVSIDEIRKVIQGKKAPDGRPATINDVANTGDKEAIKLLERIRIERKRSGKDVSLREVIDYPELFAAYPSAKNIRVKFLSMREKDLGSFYVDERGVPVITVNMRPDKATETLKHELQHFIQAKEGFSMGGNPDVLFRSDVQNILLKQQLRNVMRDKELYQSVSIKDMEYIRSLIEKTGRGVKLNGQELADIFGSQKEFDNMAFKAYTKLYGEVEANANNIEDLFKVKGTIFGKSKKGNIIKSVENKTDAKNQSGKVNLGIMGAIGAGSVPGVLASNSSKMTIANSTPATTEKQETQKSETKQKTSGLDRKELERRFVHVENRGAKLAGKNLYKQVGVTKDLGKYQVSHNSLKDWSKAWLGKTYTPEEFLNDPQAQEDFFNEFLNMAEKYKLSNDEIAIAWHTGWGELGTGSRETREDRFKVSLRERLDNPKYQKYLDTFNEG